VPQKIIRLPEEVINRIAAGEVVENPASIAKELIENSLDAGAKRIEIAIEGGGSAFLQVEDDGCGMGREDALLSLERHATSKIRTERDLLALSTMGFRGEALAAIASVSRFEMRTSEGGEGTRIEAQGGAMAAVEPCARNRGTTVSVRDLFFNVPARKKFMKSASANGAALSRMVETMALACPEVSFSLKVDGKIALEIDRQERKKRIEGLLGPMSHEAKGAGLWGLLAPPDEAKLQRRGQILFVNNRLVFSPLISRAVKAGYGTRIPDNAYPSFVLFLEIAPDSVDVNVHPQKKEVRFSEEGKIYRLCEEAVARAFEGPVQPFSRPLAFSEPLPFSLAEESPPLLHQASSLGLDFQVAERPLAIVDGYLFLQAEGLLLVDLRLAYARVLYESLKEKQGAAQSLMWPLETEVEEEGMVEELQAMGIECRLIGKRRLAVDALPALLEPSDFPDFLQAWVEGKKRLDLAASRYAKGTKRVFTADEAYLLWKQLLKCRDSLYDPGGRRIWKRVEGEHLKSFLEGR